MPLIQLGPAQAANRNSVAALATARPQTGALTKLGLTCSRFTWAGGDAEERVTLLVKPDNEPARRAYEKWGYTHVGRIQPFADGPTFDSMVKTLS